jgi:hypothetical protein
LTIRPESFTQVSGTLNIAGEASVTLWQLRFFNQDRDAVRRRVHLDGHDQWRSAVRYVYRAE